jgi:tRNA A-37 threonylcarbamoyl transferase component Bud32
MSSTTKLDYNRLDKSTVSQLRSAAKDMEIPRYTTMNKETLLQEIKVRFKNYEKYKCEENINKYKRMCQLGCKGKEGDVYLVKRNRSNREYAMKKFNSKKSGARIEQEAKLQKIGSQIGISPKIIEYDTDAKFIVMERLEQSLFDILKTQKTKLKIEQQKRIISIFKALDTIEVFHGDPSVLNFLVDKTGKLYIIDYGMAKKIDNALIKKHGTKNLNMKFMVLGLLVKLKEMFPEVQYTYLMKFVSDSDKSKFGLGQNK